MIFNRRYGEKISGGNKHDLGRAGGKEGEVIGLIFLDLTYYYQRSRNSSQGHIEVKEKRRRGN